MSMKVFIQSQDAECGLASLACILSHHKHFTTLRSLRMEFDELSDDGMNALEIIECAEEKGLTASPFEIESVSDLYEIEKPCIVHWENNHFVVFKKAKNGTVWFIDPAVGLETMEAERFFEKQSNLFIEFEENEHFKTQKSEQSTFASVFYFIKKENSLKRIWATLFSLALLIEVCSMMLPMFNQSLIDDILPQFSLNYLSLVSIGIFMAIASQSALLYLFDKIALTFSAKIKKSFRHGLMEHFLGLPGEFVKSRTPSDVASKFDALNEIKDTLFQGSVKAFIASLSVLIASAFALYTSPILFVITSLFLLAFTFINKFSSKRIENIKRTVVESKIKEDNALLETIHGFEVAKSFGIEKLLLNRWGKHNINHTDRELNLDRAQFNIRNAETFTSGVHHLAIMCLGVFMVNAGLLSLGGLFAYIAYAMILLRQFDEVINFWINAKLLSPQLSKIDDVLMEQPETDTLDDMPTFANKITLSNIGYKIKGEDEFLFRNINLVINKGDSLVITGRSGCGKSTLLKIICGLTKPSEGLVIVDDTTLTSQNASSYRKQNSVVIQGDGQIFNASIIDNLTLFSESPDMDRLDNAIEVSCFLGTLESKKMGLDTLISPVKNNLSGGEKQRLLLARAIYMNPAILFIDEGTSALDVPTEVEIVKNLKSQSMTKVSIAHREESVKLADRTFNLQEHIEFCESELQK
jgi:ATP-binding cassette subfamily B protein RaxB